MNNRKTRESAHQYDNDEHATIRQRANRNWRSSEDHEPKQIWRQRRNRHKANEDESNGRNYERKGSESTQERQEHQIE